METLVIRCTAKALRRLRIASTEPSDVTREPGAVEWYCNLVRLERKAFFLFAEERSLFGVWVPVAGVSARNVGDALRESAAEACAAEGLGPEAVGRLVPGGQPIFARTADRSMLGSMVDYARMAEIQVAYDGGLDRVTLSELNRLCNETPMKRLGMRRPEDVLREIFGLTPRVRVLDGAVLKGPYPLTRREIYD